jgi:hypothetical protein
MILPRVRLAGPGDEGKLFDLLGALAEDNNSFEYELDDEMIMAHISQATDHKGGICGIVDAPNGVIAGATNIIWDRWFFEKRYHLQQTFFFVRTEHRKSRIADALMDWSKHVRAMIELDEGYKVPLITAFASEKNFNAKARWWRKHCGEPIGLIYTIR